MRGGFCGCGFWREIDLSQKGGGDLSRSRRLEVEEEEEKKKKTSK
jgi:hypothetical protein